MLLPPHGRRPEDSLAADLVHSFKYTLRTFRRLIRTPSFTLLTILTLALGIGANTAVFTVVERVLLTPLPYEDPSELIQIWFEVPGQDVEQLNQSSGTYMATRSEQRTLVDIGLWNPTFVNVRDAEGTERVDAMHVSDGTLPLLGVNTAIGRLFTAGDDSPDAPGTTVLSWGYWMRMFSGDEAAIGKVLEVHGENLEIIGVLPKGFRFLDHAPDLYLPFRLDPARATMSDFSLRAIARMQLGISMQEVEQDIRRIIPVMFDRYLGPSEQARLRDNGFAPVVHLLRDDIIGDVGSVLWVILGSAYLLLVLACVNATNLYLVRADGRTREMAIRLALGGGTGTVVREFLGESLLLSFTGGLVGTAFAWAGLEVLHAIHPANLPRLEEIALNGTVLLYALTLSLVGGLLPGLIPALRLSSRRLFGSLREGGWGGTGGRDRQRTRSLLVAVQIAVALVLLAGAGLMTRTFFAILAVDPGYREPRTILTTTLSVPQRSGDDDEHTYRVLDGILDSVRRIPGVESASLGYSVPMAWAGSGHYLWVEDVPVPEGTYPPGRENNWIMPDYFRTLGTRLLAGREFTVTEVDEGRPVAIITGDLALEFWNTPQEAIGKRVRENGDPSTPWKEIIGVVQEIRDDGPGAPPVKMVYWPLMIRDFHGRDTYIRSSVYLTVRSPRVGNPGFVGELRGAVQAVASDIPLASVMTMHEIAADSTARTTFTLIILATAAIVALILGMVGIYGVASYAVNLRSREIGIRMALGADDTHVRSLVLRQGLTLALAGIVVGLAVSLGVTRLMAGLLYGVHPIDPISLGGVTVLLLLTVTAANLVPARRASRIDPARILNDDG